MVFDIRTRGFTLTPGLRAQVERRLDFALDRHRERIARIRVVLDDVNGPRGGSDKRCTVDLGVRGAGRVRATSVSGDAYAAIDEAAHRAQRALSRAVERERTATLELLWRARAAERSPSAG